MAISIKLGFMAFENAQLTSAQSSSGLWHSFAVSIEQLNPAAQCTQLTATDAWPGEEYIRLKALEARGRAARQPVLVTSPLPHCQQKAAAVLATQLRRLASASGIDSLSQLPQLGAACAVAARIMAAVISHASEAGERQRSSGSSDAAWAPNGELGGILQLPRPSSQGLPLICPRRS